MRPTIFPSVPRVYEKIHAAVVAGFDERTGAERRIVDWALGVGRRVSQLRQAKQPIPPLLAVQHRLADKLVYSKVKEKLGGRLRVANAGGAPLSRDIAEFFHAIDILVLEGYGLSEVTTAATVNRPSAFKFGTVGRPLPGVELRLAEDGEILIRSNTVFAGYYHDDEATRATIDDEGFVHTGDVGHIDEDGFLVITDRKKDIIVTAGGKNVAPQNLENELKAHRVISQALVVGDRKPYIAALVTLDEEATDGMSEDAARSAVQEAVDAVNAERSRYEQIKRFTIVPREFTAEHDEVTPTLKLKRNVIIDHFAAEVAAFVRLEDSAGADERRGVPRLVEAGNLDDVAGVRRVHELVAADVDADMPEPVEEDEVDRAATGRARPARRSRTARTTSAAATRRPARTPTSRAPSSRSRRVPSRPRRTAC